MPRWYARIVSYTDSRMRARSVQLVTTEDDAYAAVSAWLRSILAAAEDPSDDT